MRRTKIFATSAGGPPILLPTLSAAQLLPAPLPRKYRSLLLHVSLIHIKFTGKQKAKRVDSSSKGAARLRLTCLPVWSWSGARVACRHTRSHPSE